MGNVFLVQSVVTDTFHKLAKEGLKSHDFDCAALVSTFYVCKSKQAAVKDCRDLNRKQTASRYFVNEVSFY